MTLWGDGLGRHGCKLYIKAIIPEYLSDEKNNKLRIGWLVVGVSPIVTQVTLDYRWNDFHEGHSEGSQSVFTRVFFKKKKKIENFEPVGRQAWPGIISGLAYLSAEPMSHWWGQ